MVLEEINDLAVKSTAVPRKVPGNLVPEPGGNKVRIRAARGRGATVKAQAPHEALYAVQIATSQWSKVLLRITQGCHST